MFRLELRDRNRSWRTGRIVYPTYLDAQARQEELRLKGISSRVVDAAGAKTTI